jgi:fascin 1/2
MEPAPIQLALRANSNNKWVSIKQGVDVSANQNEITSIHETFQLEQKSSSSWHIRTKEGNFWAIGAAAAIQTSSRDEKSAGNFRLKWNADDGTCALLVTNKDGDDEASMKWVCARKSGQLFAGNADPVGFYVMFLNRTSLNLRAVASSGFVGLKVAGATKLEAGKTAPDSILVDYANDEHKDDIKGTFNCCYLKMPANNKYWSMIDGSQVACDSTSVSCAQQFHIELRTGSTIAIRLRESSSYLTLTGQGGLLFKGCPPNEATLWEF